MSDHPARLDVVLKRFEAPDEVRHFEKGTFEVLTVGGMTIGRASYEPGWKWSEHVGPGLGQGLCNVEHIGMVVSGRATAAFGDGRVVEMQPGEVFYIPPEPHDSWVVGDEPYVSLHFLGAGSYSTNIDSPSTDTDNSGATGAADRFTETTVSDGSK